MDELRIAVEEPTSVSGEAGTEMAARTLGVKHRQIMHGLGVTFAGSGKVKAAARARCSEMAARLDFHQRAAYPSVILAPWLP